jgi:hypothetical protein
MTPIYFSTRSLEDIHYQKWFNIFLLEFDSSWHFAAFYFTIALTTRAFSTLVWMGRRLRLWRRYQKATLKRSLVKGKSAEWWRTAYGKASTLHPMGGSPVLYALLAARANAFVDQQVQ